MAGGSQRRPAEILLIEDDPGDQELTRRALQEERAATTRLLIAGDGDEALGWLHQRVRAPDAHPSLPDLVLLDLNLPGAPGKKILETLKTDPALRAIPVVVLTTSARPSDIRECYELGANAYVVKPLDARQFFRAFHAIHEFWIGVASLPES